MTVCFHAQDELHCDEAGTAMSQRVSFPGRKMSDGLVLFLRKQNKVDEQVFQFLMHMKQHFLQTFCLLEVCILRLQYDLFRCFYSVFSLLDFVFRSSFFPLFLVFVDVFDAIRSDKFYTCLYDRQASLNALEICQEALLRDTICTSSPYKILLSVDGV
jgi:hypothetical protein